MKKCPECGTMFEKQGKRKYCGDRCRSRRDSRVKYRANKILDKEYGRSIKLLTPSREADILTAIKEISNPYWAWV